MKRIVLALLFVLSAASAAAQATIPVSGTKVLTPGGTKLTGILRFTVTDTSNTPVTYTVLGGSPSTAVIDVPVTLGVVQNVGGFPPQIPNPATMSPSNTRYRIQVCTAACATVYYTLPFTNITLANFSYDSYSVAPNITVSGLGLPGLKCSPTALYTNTLASDPYPWVCSLLSDSNAVYWTQNPSLSPSCSLPNLAIASPIGGGPPFCIPTLSAYATPGFVMSSPLTGQPAGPIALNVISSGGANFPSTPGIVYNTSTSAARNAVFGDVVTLWASCTSGFLKFDGTCANPAGAGTVTAFTAPSGSWPTWLVPTVTNGTSTPNLAVAASAIPFGALASLSANQVLGALTATTASGLNMPSCSTATSALEWTSGTGFGCHTITPGTGTVTTFSAGVLSPLFTTSVANPTTAPALSFTASTAAQNAVLAGPASGGTGAYSFRALVAADIPALTGYVLTAPVANQTITQPSGTGFGNSYSNWGINPVTGLSDANGSSGTFSTYTGDTGGSSVSGGVNMRTDIVNFTDPGWNLGAGFAFQPGSAWQVSTGYHLVTNSNAAGIKNGIYSPLVCNGEGDCNGISNSTVYHGNQTEGAGEGNTGIENQMVEGGGTSATVVTGGSKATTIVLSGGNGIGIGRLAIDTTSGGTSTTQTLGSGFGNFQIVNLGATVPVSTCGTVAGGALIGTTQYSIASNILTVFASNSFFPSEQLTLSGYTTSSFLNGTYIIFNANSTSFQINFTHANVSLTTEAGFVNTTNVDTPRQAGAGSIAMTFGVTLGSAYSLPSPAPIATYAGPGWSDSERVVSVGSYTGGVQYLTMNLYKPISNGANLCIGGLAGYVEKNTTTGGEFYNYILGSPTSTSAYVYAMRQGSPTLQFVYAGNVTMYPAATVRSYVPGTNTVTLTDNDMASAVSDNYSIPDGIIASYSFQNNNLLNLNPNAVLLGSQYRYTGSPLIFGGQMLDVYPGTPSNLISQGGTGRAPVGMLFEAVVGAGLQFRNPPSDCADGNSCNNALMNVDCEVATVTCAPTYDIWHDGNGTSRDAELLFTRGSNLINFLAAAGPSAVLQVNGHQVCDSSGAGGGSCGGSGPTIQTNTVNNASQVLLNFTTSTANSVGLTATPVNTSGGIQKFEITGSSYTGNAATASALASTPTLCTTGNAPTGILANGNATGCASISGSSGISGATSGQALIAGSPTTATSSKPLAGTGAGLVTGPTTAVSGNFAAMSGTGGQIADSGLTTGTSGGTIPLLNGANTWSSQQTFAQGMLSTLITGASASNFYMQVAPFSGGSGTTTWPQIMSSPGLGPSTWSTGGTFYGVSAQSGFAGNFLDFHVNGGASLAKLDSGGNLTVASCTGCGGGGTSWNAITTPTGNLALTFPSANTTVLTAGSATSTANFFTLQDTTGNTGTGDLLKVGTVGTSAMQPFEVLAKGTSAFKVLATGETGATGKLFVNAASNVQGAGLYVGSNGIYSAAGQSVFLNGTSGSTGTVLSLNNQGTPANNTGASLIFQVINSGFSFITPASISAVATNVTAGSESSTVTLMNMNGGSSFGGLILSGPGNATILGTTQSAKYATATNCASSASPAVCGSAVAGAFTIAAATTSVTVNTSAVTANSEIQIQPDSSLGTRLSVTCNTSLATVIGPVVTARTAGTSFTVSITGTLVTNPACYSYSVIN